MKTPLKSDRTIFLEKQTKRLIDTYELMSELCVQDFTEGAYPTKPTDDEEQLARMADKIGMDGNIFRSLFPCDPEKSGLDLRELENRIYDQMIMAAFLLIDSVLADESQQKKKRT